MFVNIINQATLNDINNTTTTINNANFLSISVIFRMNDKPMNELDKLIGCSTLHTQ